MIIGAGPRGLSVLERLAAHARRGAAKSVEVNLVDPFPPGAGHVWRTDQSRHFLMNTPAFFPTVVASSGTLAGAPGDFPAPVPAIAGLSFDQWRREVGENPGSAVVGLSDEDLSELRGMSRTDFPSRKIYGTYLSDVFARLRGSLPRNMCLRSYAQEAVRLAPSDGRGARRYRVELGDGEVLSADAVVLALGHTDAKLRDDQRDLLDFAAEHNISYWPPAVPADVHWDQLPHGESVLIRGMGLNFHDVLARLTEGRGGYFEQDDAAASPHRLVYRPSGLEPKVWVGSRRGTPYRSKAVLETYYPRTVDNRFFTRAVVERIRAAAEAEGREVDFEAEYWPLIRKDAQWNYYVTLARTEPEAIEGDPRAFLSRVDEALSHTGSSWWNRLDRVTAQCVAPNRVLTPEALARPFEGQSFGSHEEYAAALVHFLDRDVAASFAAEDSPVKMAIGSLNASRPLVKHAVRDHGISADSWVRGLERRFGSLVDGLSSGPPVLRIQQMAALARAGVLRFIGPDPLFRADEHTGTFVASSPWVRDEPVHARWMIEALAPANDVRLSTSPLINNLFEEGFARPWQLRLGESTAPAPGKGFEVTASPYRLVTPEGVAAAGVYALGLQLTSAQWGTAIAAETDAPLGFSAGTLADANDIAKDILR